MRVYDHSSRCSAIDDNHVNETVLGMSFIKNRMAIFDRELAKFRVLPVRVVRRNELPFVLG